MNAETIVKRACELGITLQVDGDQIRYAPKSRTPEDFIKALREHKPDVLIYLSQNPKEIALQNLLAWASYLAEQDIVLPESINYVEADLRKINTPRISWYAAHYLITISDARLQQETGGWGIFTSQWWEEREREAFNALANLRTALNEVGETKP